MTAMERKEYERYGSGSRWVGSLGLAKDPLQNVSPRMLLNKVKALREDNPVVFERLVIACGRWVQLSTFGDAPYSESETKRLKDQMTAMGMDLKAMREFVPPPPKPMDGYKLLMKLKAFRADQPDDFKLLTESHAWLTDRIGGTEPFGEDDVLALLSTLEEMGVDAKTLREAKPEMDGGLLLNKLRGYQNDNPDGFAAILESHPWLSGKIDTGEPLEADEVTALLAALVELKVDVNVLRAVRLHHTKARQARTRLLNASLRATPLQDAVMQDSDAPKAKAPAKAKDNGKKKSRWANARFANNRIILPRRTIPVLVPDEMDQSVAAQIFGKVLEFANGKGTSERFGKLVRRISTSSSPELAVDMQRHGAFADMNSYMAEKELDKRLEGLAEWHAVEIAALFTALMVDPMDMLGRFNKDDGDASGDT